MKKLQLAFRKNHFFPFFLPWRSCVAGVTVYLSQTEFLSPDFATCDDLITMDRLEFWWFEKGKHYLQRRLVLTGLRTNCTDHIVTWRNNIYIKAFIFFIIYEKIYYQSFIFSYVMHPRCRRVYGLFDYGSSKCYVIFKNCYFCVQPPFQLQFTFFYAFVQSFVNHKANWILLHITKL